VRSHVQETTAFGAACMAGLATGVWRDEVEISETWSEDTRFEPQMRDADRVTLRARWDRAVARTLGWDC